VNGREVGKTPLSDLLLPVGEYKAELTLVNHQSASATFQVQAEKNTEVSMKPVNPRAEAWNRIKGKYHGKLTSSTGEDQWMSLELEIYGDFSAPVMNYTKTISRAMFDFPSTSHCSNDPKIKSRFPITVRYSEGGVMTILEKDKFFAVGDVEHLFTFHFQQGEGISATYADDIKREPEVKLVGNFQKAQ